MKATITSKGQITIPKALRERLKLGIGSVLEFDEKAGHLIARRAVNTKKMRSVVGCARKSFGGKSVAKWLDETRGPVELP